MEKKEFLGWIMENYNVSQTHFDYELLENVLDYGEGMEETDQYNYLCRMIPQVPERIIRDVCY